VEAWRLPIIGEGLAMQDYDKGSKCLIRRHGDSILRLSGARDLISWRAVQAEPVQPRRLPDGMIEACLRGRPRPVLYVLEVSTYPYARLAKQAADDALLVYLERGIVPEVITLVLRPRGRKPVPRERVVRSDEGTTHIQVGWKVVELWTIPAADLLAAGDAGLIPLVPLARFDGPLDPILEECREQIDEVALKEERENLRVVTHFFAGLKYNDPRLFQKLGGQKAMFKTGSPLLREIIEEETEKARRKGSREMAELGISRTLAARFGVDTGAVRGVLKRIPDDRLEDVFALAATCPDLASFREQIPSRKRKRRS
jgi:hypothetical protein